MMYDVSYIKDFIHDLFKRHYFLYGAELTYLLGLISGEFSLDDISLLAYENGEIVSYDRERHIREINFIRPLHRIVIDYIFYSSPEKCHMFLTEYREEKSVSKTVFSEARFASNFLAGVEIIILENSIEFRNVISESIPIVPRSIENAIKYFMMKSGMVRNQPDD